MRSKSNRNGGLFRIGSGGLAVVFTAALVGADSPTNTITAGGMTFQTPVAWKSTTPSSSMRLAQIKIDPVEGDTDPAELTVFGFPGGAGGVQANVARWENQFKDKDGKPAKASVKTQKGQNIDVTSVEISGHFFPPAFPGQPKQADKPNYRLLGAIALSEDIGYYLRLVGPEKTVAAAKPDFEKLIASITIKNK
jgi:hypothetical protein